VRRWRWTYKGGFDGNSAAEHSQPSWHTFDHYAWTDESGCKLELTRNPDRMGRKLLPKYRLRLFDPHGDVKQEWFGDCWQKLVKRVKTRLAYHQDKINGAVATFTSDALVEAYNRLSPEEKREFSKKIWKDALEVFGIE
jgi:hypothetical protein